MEAETCDLKSLSSRISKLEVQNRRWKYGAVVLATVVSALTLMGQSQTGHIMEADQFVLKDETGNARARLSIEAGGKPALAFYDAHGGIVLSLVGGDESSLLLGRPGSSEQVQLSANKYFYGLALYDAQSHRAGISVQKGAPGLDLFDQDGKKRVSLTSNSAGPAFSLSDSEGKAGLSLRVASPGGGPTLVLSDKDGKVLFSAPQQ